MHPDTSLGDYLKLIERQQHVQWQRQADFLHDENGHSMVDFIGRFECFGRDARIVFERLGLECTELPHKNVTSHRPYREYFDAQSRETFSRSTRPISTLSDMSFKSSTILIQLNEERNVGQRRCSEDSGFS